MKLKFRMYNKQTNEMLYSKDAPHLSQFFLAHEVGIAHKMPIEIMQSTGIIDKNGVEVYVGDIVQDSKGFGVVYYYAPSFIVQCLPDEVTEDGVYALAKGLVNVTQLEETEVIGNIHQHPNLLTK